MGNLENNNNSKELAKQANPEVEGKLKELIANKIKDLVDYVAKLDVVKLNNNVNCKREDNCEGI